MDEDSTQYLAFALHVSEIPKHELERMFREFPDSFMPARQCFVFKYLALPFGLSSSCKTFNDLVTALVGFWRRCPTGTSPTRASSYIDDIISATGAFDEVSRA
jgi:hypothetical protein